MLSLKDVSKYYSNPGGDHVTALNEVSLTIRPAEFCVILGTNGSGKSTLLNLIAGTVSPTRGTILWDQRPITDARQSHRPLVAMVHQNPELGTSPSLTAAENLALAMASLNRLSFRRLLSRKRLIDSSSILFELGIDTTARVTTPVYELSGGQRQALAIRMAVLRRPKILLLDEPSAALDPKRAKELGDLTEQLWREHRLMILMVTHQVPQAIRYGTRLLFMHAGRIVRDIAGDAKQHLKLNELTELYQTAYAMNPYKSLGGVEY